MKEKLIAILSRAWATLYPKAKARLAKSLRQESTWRGIIALLTSSGVYIEPEFANWIIATGIGMIGLINVTKND